MLNGIARACARRAGAIAVMTGERVTRPDYTVQAIKMAVTALNPQHYKCGPAVRRVCGGVRRVRVRPRRLAILAHPAMRVCMRARAFVCVRAARSYGHALKRVHTSSGLIPHPSPTAPHP